MDYDWKYYLDDLKAGKSRITVTDEDREAAGHIMCRLPEEQLEQAQRYLYDMLRSYREQPRELNAIIDDVMRLHTAYCKKCESRDILHRRHNAIVYSFMINTHLSERAVAIKLNTCKEVVRADKRIAIRDLLVILFGVPAIGGTPDRWTKATDSLFKAMRLLPYSVSISQHFPDPKWERERIRCSEITAEILHCVDKAIQMYEEYVSGCLTTKDTAERSLETIRAIFLEEGSRPVVEIAEEWSISKESIYSYIAMGIRKFSTLFEYMATGRLPDVGA